MKAIVSPELLSEIKLSLLREEDQRSNLQDILKSSPNPTAALIAIAGLRRENFYPKLAQICGLSYVSAIPMPIAPQKTIALQVPARLLVQHHVYPYQEDGKVKLALSNPFIDPEIIEDILSYLGVKEYEIVLAHPQAINEALSQVLYYSFAISSEMHLEAHFPEHSAQSREVSVMSRVVAILLIMLLLACVFFIDKPLLLIIFGLISLSYFLLNIVKMYTFFRAFFAHKVIEFTTEEIEKIRNEELPIYTIIIPLKEETVMVPHIIDNLLKLEYPHDKLDLKFAVEASDTATLLALEKAGVGHVSPNASRLDFSFEVVEVPPGTVSTKPRSCNFALKFARGSFCVIYDAEDRPAPDQLKKAYAAFMKSSLDTMCMQAKLNFYNSRQNLLTRFFSLEYGFWFDFYLPGLHALNSPIPLGGTSNHFITRSLRRIGTWDAYNVTEDADIGLRLSRFDKKTEIFDSYTLEEANSRLGNWIKQRARWQKGFLMTSLVHFLHPVAFVRQVGPYNAFMAVATFGTTYVLPFINPLLWYFFIISLLPPLHAWGLPGLPPSIAFLASFNLILGNLTYILVHFLGGIKIGRYDLAPFAVVIPFYWIFISVATYLATYDIIFRPHHWAKTKHGYSVVGNQ